MASSQVNIRIPILLKHEAQKKAENMGMNLSAVLKLFLEKFVKEDVLKIQKREDVEWEKVFNKGVKEHFMGKKGRANAKMISNVLREDPRLK